ncbi:DNA-binding MarR family transcriptional regulator [Nocardioides zeae]|uniref:DNA-binding MarR family transcriptional regulator n=2 Tax=Nocardioides zeae TaxID=1457234 RepID=A0ACC6IF63_9ACTN|nr:MarR family transcriptional regulator [Nocardioides zeae]MDQ1105437.1 DNA-binding MarR family transcriptional regulator [Nocardioides zeae]MDR6174866.1 DNA-binding MarR family transcriptional regulator [Nocardioides zeae]MDR6209324.1 DNA-binding MarR family transcriptional regulator [Nocardioides zeae]
MDDQIDPEMEDAWAEACNGIYRVLKRGRGAVGRRAGGSAISEAQVAMLESVAHRGPLQVGEIATHAGLAQPTVTRMLNTLQRDAIIRRLPSPHDERAVLVELTDEGRELWQQKRELLRFWQRDALLRFPAEQRSEVVSMLATLVDIIEDQIADR